MSETADNSEKEYIQDVKLMNEKIREISQMMRQSKLQPIDVAFIFYVNL